MADEAVDVAAGLPGNLYSFLKKAVELYEKEQRRSENESLGQVRSQNNMCLHLVVMGGHLGKTPHDSKADREIKSNRGVFFSSVNGRTFYHPDPFFTPNGWVQWLVRSDWKAGEGLNSNSTSPIVSATSIGYRGFWWRQSSNDKGGGDTREGFCRICAKEQKELESY